MLHFSHFQMDCLHYDNAFSRFYKNFMPKRPLKSTGKIV